MPEEVLFESERRQPCDEIARHLRSIAEKLETGEPITLSEGSDSITVEIPRRPTFEIKVEREGNAPDTELSVELEIEWPEEARRDEDGDGELSIE